MALFSGFTTQAFNTNEQPKKDVVIEHIFFDLHGVGVVRSWGNGISQVGATAETFYDKLRLLGQTVGCLFDPECHRGVWRLGLRPPFCGTTEYGKNKVIESYFNILEKNGYDLLYKELIRFSNNIFVPNKEMIPVLAALQQRGYNLHLFSNIGPRVLKDAQERNLFNNVLEYFPNGNVINNNSQDSYDIFKPQGRSFDDAITAAGATPETSLMIEDKISNLPTTAGIEEAQRKAAKKGYRYTAPKKWADGLIYHAKDHLEFVEELKKRDLLDQSFGENK